jgi:hypothetical protein
VHGYILSPRVNIGCIPPYPKAIEVFIPNELAALEDIHKLDPHDPRVRLLSDDRSPYKFGSSTGDLIYNKRIDDRW